MTARRNVAEFGPENLLALRNLPLPMQVRAATSQESSAAAAPEEDPDVEDDWDCEQDDLTEEESSYTTTSCEFVCACLEGSPQKEERDAGCRRNTLVFAQLILTVTFTVILT